MTRQLFDRTIHFLRQSLDLSTFRHKVLSGNIANAEVPDYVAKDVAFETVLARSINRSSSLCLEKTHPDHLSETFESEMLMESSPEGVNIDQEMSKLAQNNLMFQAGVEALVRKLEALKVAIIEGAK